MKHIVFGITVLLIVNPGFTQSSDQPLFRFGVVADVQYCDCETSGSRHYRESPEKFRKAVEELNKHDLQFVASLGDFIDRDFASFSVVNEIAKDLKAPLWHAIGNHEWSVDEPQKTRVQGQLDLEKRYYSKSLQGWRFIFLDGNAVSLYGTADGSRENDEARTILRNLEEKGAPNAFKWNGALGSKQLKWVEKELKAADRSDQQVIFMCHFPVRPYPGSHNLWDDKKLLEIIDQNDHVVAYFNGHVHKGHYEEVSKVHYVTFDGMVEHDTNAFAIVSVFDDRLEVNGYGREQDRVLTINED